jgi:adenosylcobinamide hydrolase
LDDIPAQDAYEDCEMMRRDIPLEMDNILAEVFYHEIAGHGVKTLVVDFGEECRMLSTACGYKTLRYAANHYIPEVLWEYNLDNFGAYLTQVYESLKSNPKDYALLVTGVDMDNLAYRRANTSEFGIGCIVTAGVRGNAMRAGVDKARAKGFGISPASPGTINVILFTDANFSDGAMAMAIMSITEAKTAALQDLNVHSAYTPENIATGTGTDGITVVSGRGVGIPSTSGHLRVGELVGRCVRQAVIDALGKQDGLIQG